MSSIGSVFNQYYNMINREMRNKVQGYEKLSDKDSLPAGAERSTAIKVDFTDGRKIKVYKKGKRIEWC